MPRHVVLRRDPKTDHALLHISLRLTRTSHRKGNALTNALRNQRFIQLYKHMHLAHKLTLAFVCSKAPTEESENQIIIAEALLTLMRSRGAELTAEES